MLGGLLTFIALIAWLPWEGPLEDQKKDDRPSCRRKENAKRETSVTSSRLSSFAADHRTSEAVSTIHKGWKTSECDENVVP